MTSKSGNGNILQIMSRHFYKLMKQALREAEKGFASGEVPIGAVLAGPDGEIVASAHNQPVSLKDPTAHAEILVLRSGGAFFKNYRLQGTTLLVTLEPCVMCMGAALNARVTRLIFGAFDPKSGAAGSLYNIAADRRLNHRIEVIPGIMEKECGKMLQDFFHIRRVKKKSVERYRSGRNGVDSKSTCPVNSGARGFESHPLRH